MANTNSDWNRFYRGELRPERTSRMYSIGGELISIADDYTAEEIVGMMTKTHRELEDKLFDDLGIAAPSSVVWQTASFTVPSRFLRDDIRLLADQILEHPYIKVESGAFVAIDGAFWVEHGDGVEAGVRIRPEESFDENDPDADYEDVRVYHGGDLIDAALALNEYRVFLSYLDKAMRRYNSGSAFYVNDIRTV